MTTSARRKSTGRPNTIAELGRTYCTPDMTIDERIQHVGVTVTPAGCHEWNGGRNDQGYGNLWVGKKCIYLHRYALERKLGRPLAAGMGSLHRCDNPPCMNAEHLFEGDKPTNNRDMVLKGRASGGRVGGAPKHPAEAFATVFRMRAKGAAVHDIYLATPFSKSYIYGLLNGTSKLPGHAAEHLRNEGITTA